MEDEEIGKLNFILQFMAAAGKPINIDQYGAACDGEGFENSEDYFLLEKLMRLRLIDYVGKDKYFITLTEPGEIAAADGIENKTYEHRPQVSNTSIFFNENKTTNYPPSKEGNLKRVISIGVLIAVLAGLILWLIITPLETFIKKSDFMF